MNDIDEELFLTVEKKQANAVNLTPFSRQGGYNKLAPAPFPQEKYGGFNSNSTASSITPSNKSAALLTTSATTFTSQRFLNYSNENINESKQDSIPMPVQPKQQQRIVVESTPNHNKFASPFQSMKNLQQPLQQMRGAATPITNAMEMYNWLHSRKNVISCSTGTIALELNKKVENLDAWLQQSISKVIDLERKETAAFLGKPDYTIEARVVDSRIAQISSLFYRVLNEYYNEEKKVNMNIQKGVLVCACESVYFILNTKTLSFERLVEFIGISWFELWKIMDFFMRLDQTMPVSLKAHVLDLEVKVISYNAWREDSLLLTFVKTYIVDSENAKALLEDRQEGYSIEKFFRRVMHQCAYTIHQVCASVKLSETISEGVWRMMKHILGNDSSMLIGRHIDQLVLCSVYVMCKILKSDTQFRTILNKYEELNSHNKAMMRELIYDMPITSDKRDNIVEFYNSCFLIAVKKTALSIGKQLTAAQQTSTSSPQAKSTAMQATAKNPALATPMFTSPLKAVFPSDVGKSMTKLPSHMTPQTQMLYAYTESPFLKDMSQAQQQYASAGGSFRSVNSKKMINFDSTDAHKPLIMTGSSSNTPSSNTANRFFEKIPFAKYIKPKMDSIMESQQEQSASHSIQNKFVKRVTDGQVKTEPLEVDSSLNEMNSSQSNVSSTPRIAGGSSSSNNGSTAAGFMKNFQKPVLSNVNTNMLSPLAKSQRSLLLLTPTGRQTAGNVPQQQPLTQIPLQKINSWQNQHNSFTSKLQQQDQSNQQMLQNQQQQQKVVAPLGINNAFFDQMKKKV